MELCYNVQTCSGTSDLEEDIMLCSDVGFPYFEINFDKAQEYLKNHSMDELRRLIKESGLKCASVNAIFDISFCTKERWASLCSEFNFACELGKACGTDKIIVLPSERSALSEDITDTMIFEDTVEILTKLAEMGNPHNMKIAFEPVGTMAVGDIQIAMDIIGKVDRLEVGLVLDNFNMFLWDLCSDLDKILNFDPEKIFIVHINDAEKLPFAKIDQMHRCMPGDGRIDVKKYIGNLKAIGYEGIVSIEVLNPKIWEKGPKTVIPEAYQKIKAFVT